MPAAISRSVKGHVRFGFEAAVASLQKPMA
jgi:hypothetical protein